MMTMAPWGGLLTSERVPSSSCSWAWLRFCLWPLPLPLASHCPLPFLVFPRFPRRPQPPRQRFLPFRFQLTGLPRPLPPLLPPLRFPTLLRPDPRCPLRCHHRSSLPSWISSQFSLHLPDAFCQALNGLIELEGSSKATGLLILPLRVKEGG